MTGPEDERAAAVGGHGHLRTSRTDRERVIELLKAAFAQGRLAKDEFDLRVGQVLAMRTYADLQAATAGIPAGVIAVQKPRTRPGRSSTRRCARWCGRRRRGRGIPSRWPGRGPRRRGR